MRLSEYLSSDIVAASLPGKNKSEVLRGMAELACRGARHGLSAAQIYDAFVARERLATTGVGSGVAIPHGRFPVADFGLAVGCSPAGVDFDSIDGQPVHIIVAVLAPEGNPAAQLRMLARVSKLLRPAEIRQSLISAPDVPQMLALLRGADSALGA